MPAPCCLHCRRELLPGVIPIPVCSIGKLLLAVAEGSHDITYVLIDTQPIDLQMIVRLKAVIINMLLFIYQLTEIKADSVMFCLHNVRINFKLFRPCPVFRVLSGNTVVAFKQAKQRKIRNKKYSNFYHYKVPIKVATSELGICECCKPFEQQKSNWKTFRKYSLRNSLSSSFIFTVSWSYSRFMNCNLSMHERSSTVQFSYVRPNIALNCRDIVKFPFGTKCLC